VGNITQAPVQVQLGELEFTMSPLTDRDRGELDMWVRGEYLKTAKLAAGEPGDEHYDAVMKLALVEAAMMTTSRWPGSRIAASQVGVARVALQGIKHHHPKLTLEQLQGLLKSVEAQQEFRMKFELVNDVIKKEAAPSSGPDPTPSKNST
jgi:hypothetical protein